MVLCLSLTALISSCASFQNKPETVRQAQSQKNKPQAITETVKQAQSQVALGEYKKALALYAAADDTYGNDAALQHQYVRTGDRIRSAADKAFQRRAFSQAGGIYHILLESGITGRNFQEPLSFDTAYLRNRIGSCSNALMEIGLVKYREDNLDEAFSIWSKVLAFDPGNKAVTKALQTTSKQRKMLKDIGSAPK
jgi:tetratricopeptide (TPR) repeat protein